MSSEAIGKAEWLDRIVREQAAWEAIVSQVDDADMDRPGATGDWTFKDVAAHLNAWRVRTVDRLEAVVHDAAPPPPLWPAGLDEDSKEGVEEGVDAINAWIYERNRERPAAEILAEAREQFRRMRSAVEAVSEDDLATPGRFQWLGDYPLSAVLTGSFDHLHEDHEPAIRAWLAGRMR